jgi:hypothetical protein
MVLLGAAWLVWLAGSARADWPLPFPPGEELVYALSWTSIPAGNATLAVGPGVAPDGSPGLVMVATARSNPAVDLFYKVRDRFESRTAPDLSRSFLYRKNQKEGSYVRNNTIDFDWDQGKALRYGSDGTLRDTPMLLPGTLDPLSILYDFRRRVPAEGEVYRVPVSDGQKTVIGEARVSGRETLLLANGTLCDTLVVEPELKDLGGIFKKSPGARMFIWLTETPERVPVKLKSEVAIGHFTADLVKVRAWAGPEGNKESQ